MINGYFIERTQMLTNIIAPKKYQNLCLYAE